MRKSKIKWTRLFQRNRMHFSPSDLGIIKRNIKHTKMQKIAILLKNVLHKSKPENLFNINDEDASSKRSTDISIVVHLVILILILIPYDMFHTKVKKQNKITVSIMRKSGSRAHNPVQKVIEEVKIDTSISQEKINIQPERISDINKNELPLKQDKKIIAPIAEKGNIIKKETAEKVKQDKKNDIKDNVKQKLEIKESSKQNKQLEKDMNNKINTENTKHFPEDINKDNQFTDVADIDGVSSSNEISNISNSKNLIFAQLHACWTQTQVKSKMPKDIFVTVIITFAPNGTIANYTIENKNYANPQKSLAYSVAKDNVKIALEACKSLKGLDVRKYEEWKRTRIEFKYSNIDE